MTDHQRALRGRWAVALMFLANGFVMGAWAPQIPLLLPRHDITESVLGLLILVLGLGAVSAMLFAGRLIGRFGTRPVLRVFALSIVPVLPAVVFSPSIPVLALAMAILGALIGCMDVAMNANAVEVERRLGRAIMSSSHGFWSLGGFFGGAGGGWLLERQGAEVQALVAAGGAALIVLVAMPFLIAEDRTPAPATDSPRPRAALIPRDAAVLVLGMLALFSMVPEGAVLDWAALYLSTEFGSDVSRAALGFAFFSGAMALMRFAGDAVRNRFGAVRTLRVSAVIAACGMLGGALAPNDTMAIASFFLAGLGIANTVPIMFSAAGNLPGLPTGAGIAAVTMFGYSGILVAPSTIGFVAEHVGFRVTYGALAVLLLVVAALAGRAHHADGVRGHRRPRSGASRAHIVALAEVYPVMAQDVIGGGGVEMELRQRIAQQELATRKGHVAPRDLQRDRPRGPAVIGRIGEGRDIAARGGDAALKFGKARLGIGEGGGLLPCQPCGGARGEIAGELHLLHERHHVGIEAELQKRLGLDALGVAMRLGLGQDVGQRAEKAVIGGRGSVQHGWSPLCRRGRWNAGAGVSTARTGTRPRGRAVISPDTSA
jgi:MFS family permease